MFDLAQYLIEMAKVVSLALPFVMAIVTFLGDKLGVSGKWQFVSSLLVGLLLGGTFAYIEFYPVEEFSGWFQVGFAGLVTGLSASGVYNVGKALLSKR